MSKQTKSPASSNAPIEKVKLSKHHLYFGATFTIAASVGILLFISSLAKAPAPSAPECDGQTATIYVDMLNNKIIGGPDNGDTYKGKLNGTAGADVIVGTPGDDEINGRKGDDIICALAGDDSIQGGDGNDIIYAGNGNNEANGGKGNDKIFGGNDIDKINGYKGDDIICTYEGNDKIWGGEGNDKLDANGGDGDWINGDKNYDRCNGGETTIHCERSQVISECADYQPPTGDDDDDDDDAGYCGDLIVNGNEQCDDGNNDNNDFCSNQCENRTPICHATSSQTHPYNLLWVPDSAIDGEGANDHAHHVNDIIPITDLNNDGLISEDDCGYVPGDDDDDDDDAGYCGDSIVNGNEQCDDGNNDNNDFCSNQCENRTPICHATSSQTHPYNLLWVPDSAIDGEGANDHTNHVNDIIPITDLNNDGLISEDDCGYVPGDDDDDDDDDDDQNPGSITVCKMIIDQNDNIVNGVLYPGTTFTIDGISSVPNGPDPVGTLPTSVFTTPLTLNQDLLYDDQQNDAQCITYNDLELGDYFYDEEVLASENDDWQSPLYNDQNNTIFDSLDDVFTYSDEIFTPDPNDDENRNTDSDGHVVLTQDRPHRTIVVLNQYEIEKPPEPYCGDGNLDNGEQCDDGNNINGDGCDEFCVIEEDDNDKIQICHATGSEQNPYVVLSVSRTSATHEGHDAHENDIIPVLDFNNDGEIDEADCEMADNQCHEINVNYAGMVHGEILDEQYAPVGVHVSALAYDGRPDKAIIFDTNQTGTPDPDLEVGIGNISIIPEDITDLDSDTLVDVPNDSADGGVQTFTFDHDRDILSFTYVDKDSSSPAFASAYDGNDVLLETVAIPNMGDGSVQLINMTATGARKLTIDNPESGGVTGINLQCTPPYIEKADLGIEKEDSPDPVVAGEQLTYTLYVTNYGPDDSTGYQVIDELPDELTFVNAVTSSGSCNESAGVVTCDMNALGVNPPTSPATITITANVHSDAVGQISNNASIQNQNEIDPNEENDEDEELTNVNGVTDLLVEKSDNIDPVVAGADDQTYTISVTNNGPSDSTGYTVVDTLPVGTSFVSVNPSDVCNESAGIVTCDMGTLANGETLDPSIEITVHVDSDADNPLHNVVTVDPNEYDPNEEDNTDFEDTEVLFDGDLGIEISDNPDPVVAGNTLIYTLDIVNNGPSDVPGLQVTHNLSPEVDFVSAVPADAGNCSEAAGVVTCNLFNLASGDSTSVTVTVTIDAGTSAGTINTDASVSSSISDSNPSNDNDEEDTTIESDADLRITVNDSKDPVVAGEDSFDYEITVTNNGPSDTTGYEVTNTLPAGVTYVTYNTANGTCSVLGQVVTCTMGALDSGDSHNIDITVSVDADTPEGTITDEAEITDNDVGDSNPANNIDDEDTDVVAEVDFEVNKSDSPDPVVAGENLLYTITVINNGPSDSEGYTLTDELPDNTVFVSSNPTNPICTHNTGTVTCNMDVLPVGETDTITILVTVDPDAPSEIINNVSVDPKEEERNGEDNEDEEKTTVVKEADLSIEKSDDPDPVVAGNELTYTLHIDNNGPSDINGYTVEDTLPAEVSFVDSVPSAPCDENTGVLTCTMPALAAGDSDTIDITVSVDSYPDGGIMNNHAEVIFQNDPNPENNSDDEDTEVIPQSDLAVTIDDDIDPAPAGSNYTYTVKVTNNGPVDSTDSTVEITLPTEVSFVSSTPGGPTCTYTAGVVTCDVGALAISASKSFDIEVSTLASYTGTVNADAKITSERDPNPANDTDDEDTTIEANTDLSVTIDDNPDPVAAGSNTTYTVTVTNNGVSDSSGSEVEVNLPAEVSFISSVPGGPTCTESAGTVTCDVGALTVGDSESFDIEVQVDSSTPAGLIYADATVTTDDIDINPANDTDTEETEVVVDFDLTVVKDDETDPVIVGENEVYTITVYNNGPSDSSAFTLEDDLPPDSVTFVSATPPCAEDAGVVTCDMDPIAAGENVQITIEVTINAETRGLISNQAIITQTELPESNTDNNIDEETTLVIGPELGSSKVENDEDNIVYPRDIVTYTITILNNGEIVADDVTLHDEIDPNLININLVSVEGCGDGYEDVSDLQNNILEINGITVGLYPNSPACEVTYQGEVSTSAPAETVISNQANISYEFGPDQNPKADDLVVGGGGTPNYPSCGDGKIGAHEQCDDGNRKSGDGCSAYCKIEETPVIPEIPEEPQKTCLDFHPDRQILYTDNASIWTKDYVDFLSRIFLKDKGYFILSGDGSTYGDMDATDNTTIRPLKYTNRFEAVKIALTSACIPIYTTEQRLAAGDDPNARPDFPDFPRKVTSANPDYQRIDIDNLNFIANVFYTAYDLGIIDGRLVTDPDLIIKPANKKEWQAQWEDHITRAEILKVFVNAFDYNVRNKDFYDDSELSEFAQFNNVSDPADLTGDQILDAAINKYGDYYFDAHPDAWYAEYIPMVVKNRIVADVCMPKYVAMENGFDDYAPTDETAIRTIAAGYSCEALAEDICLPGDIAENPGFDGSEENVRALGADYNCEDLEDPVVFNFQPARFTFADNPAVRGEVFALDTRMLWLTAATDYVNSHSNTTMRNDDLIDYLLEYIKDNERNEFILAMERMVGLLQERDAAKEVSSEPVATAKQSKEVGAREFFSSILDAFNF